MTTELPPDAWVPVPLRFRHLVEGDVFLGSDGALWHVGQVHHGAQTRVAVQCGDAKRVGDLDPDETVEVLVPVSEREAVELTREQLGARLVERRNDPAA